MPKANPYIPADAPLDLLLSLEQLEVLRSHLAAVMQVGYGEVTIQVVDHKARFLRVTDSISLPGPGAAKP